MSEDVCRNGHENPDRDRNGRCLVCRRENARKHYARKQARTEWAPHNDPKKVAEGFGVKRVSTQRKIIDPETGERIIQWQIVERDRRKLLEELHELFQCMPAIPPVKARKPAPPPRSGLASVFLLGDPHIGMRADPDETRDAKWDLQTAHDTHVSACRELVKKAPPSDVAVLVSVGDTAHTDNGLNKTRKSGHQLDVTGPFPKTARQMVDTFSAMIDLMIVKFPKIEVHIARGNHDPDASIWLALCLSERYRLNEHVKIHVEESKFWYWQHGEVLLGVTHGDNVPHKGPSLHEIMSHDCETLWSSTTWRHWYVGHVHHRELQERIGVTIETMQTLAPADSHSASRYRSGRSMRCDVYSKQGLERQIWQRGV